MKAIMKSETVKTITTHYIDGAYVQSDGREVGIRQNHRPRRPELLH